LNARGESLLERVKALLERTYGMERVVDDVGRFIVGDVGYRRLYEPGGGFARVGALGQQDAKTLIREADGHVRLCIYYPDALIRCLEHYPPDRGVRDDNVDAFATLVEELDHLLCIAERAIQTRPLSLFELELHANVSKYLVLARFLAGRRPRIEARRRAWLRYHLFDKGVYCDDDPGVRSRYRDATRWAGRFLERLGQLGPADRVDMLRSFHRADAPGKLRLIRELEPRHG
jgi:hypothetical protein